MSLHTMTLQEAEGHLNELAELVDKGEEIELIRPGKPSLRIMSVQRIKAKGKRRFGQYQGQPWHMDDNFDEALPDGFWVGEEQQ